MEWLGNNWIWIAFVLGMLGMHMFGHGGHGRGSGHGGHADGNDPRDPEPSGETKKSVEAEPIGGIVKDLRSKR